MSEDRELQFSIIIPVYNRPKEIEALLGTLTEQTDPDFEVLVVEDGSEDRCEDEVRQFEDELRVRYLYKENTGPGQTRNYGAERADGNYIVFFDSDCLIPPEYIETVREALTSTWADVYGGPDRAHPSFTPIQKAINYTMTSILTTGGIRGEERRAASFKPRSFNMGIDAQAFADVGGFPPMGIYGEDLDLSLRLQRAGYSTRLLPDAYVYHKRRSSFIPFFRQVFRIGEARMTLHRLHPGSLKLVHTLPSIAVFLAVVLLIGAATGQPLFLIPLVVGAVVLFGDAWRQTRSPRIASLALVASGIQISGYGLGFLKGVWRHTFGLYDDPADPSSE